MEKKSSIEKRQEIAKAWAESRRAEFPGLSPRGSGPTNRHGAPRLPIGQHEVKNWPVLDLGHHPEISQFEWRLQLDGLCENPCVLDWKALMALEQVEDVSDFHCVTTWSCMDNRWRGVRFSSLAALAKPLPEARYLFVTASDFAPGTNVAYTTNLPLERALEDDVLLVHTWNEKPLTREHGGPVRMITPRLYAWKGAKWIKSITFLDEDRAGFWEERGYSMSAEPWFNDRYRR